MQIKYISVKQLHIKHCIALIPLLPRQLLIKHITPTPSVCKWGCVNSTRALYQRWRDQRVDSRCLCRGGARLSALQAPGDNLVRQSKQASRRGGNDIVTEIEFECCACWHGTSPLTFAVGGLDHPRAVQVVRVEVRKAGRQDGADVALDVTSAQGWRVEGERFEKQGDGWNQSGLRKRK